MYFCIDDTGAVHTLTVYCSSTVLNPSPPPRRRRLGVSGSDTRPDPKRKERNQRKRGEAKKGKGGLSVPCGCTTTRSGVPQVPGRPGPESKEPTSSPTPAPAPTLPRCWSRLHLVLRFCLYHRPRSLLIRLCAFFDARTHSLSVLLHSRLTTPATITGSRVSQRALRPRHTLL